jgi:hypothetical protein
MFTKTISNGAVKYFQRFTIFLLALVLIFGSLPVEKAYAWSYSSPSGRPGQVSVPTIRVYDQNNACAWINGAPVCVATLTLAGLGSPVAYRSPATTGTQLVAAVYTVQQWNGSGWVNITTSGPFLGEISPTQSSIIFPAPFIQPDAYQGYFRVHYTFAWFTQTGTMLGSTSVFPNLSSDFQCVTNYRLCQAYPGYFRTGSYQTGSW